MRVIERIIMFLLLNSPVDWDKLYYVRTKLTIWFEDNNKTEEKKTFSLRDL